MKKRWLIIMLSLITVLCMAFSFAACGETAGSGSDNTQQGEQGDSGNQGNQGDSGNQGDQGDQGDSGNQGDQGDQGDQGEEHEHRLTEHKAQAPTCTEDGNIAYWECEDCGDLFLDEAGTQPTDSVIDRATGHRAGAEWEQGETSHYRLCEVCGEKIPETEAPHGYGETWKSDDTFHWQVCETCGAQGEKTEHEFGDGKVCGVCHAKVPSVGLNFTLNEDKQSYSVTGIGSCEDTDLVIPSSNGDYPVTMIAAKAFNGCGNLTSVTIPGSIEQISNYAFKDCIGLTSITIPSSVKLIWNEAFRGCTGIESLSFERGSNLTEIGNNAFYGCSSLTSVVIPDSVTYIGWYAFQGCSLLESLTIGAGVGYIGQAVWKNCTELKTVTWNAENCMQTADGYMGMYDISIFANCSNLNTVTIGENVQIIPNMAFYHCEGLQNLTFRGEKLVSIAQQAFERTALTDLTLPDGLKKIGGSAFEHCDRLQSVTIPGGVTYIEVHAFEACSGLTSVTVPESLTLIGGSVFANCSGLQSVIWNARNCMRSTAVDGGDLIFGSCANLTSVTFGENVRSIPGSLFSGCSGLTAINIPDTVISIGDKAFDQTAYYTDNSHWTGDVLYIGSHLIKAKNTLSGSVSIQAGTKTIADNAFWGCSGLTEVTIPDSVISIGSSAFHGTAYYNDDGHWAGDLLYIGSHLIAAKNTLSGSVSIQAGTKTIAGGVFWGLSGLTEVTIPDSVVSIGSEAFYGCSGLTSVAIPASVTYIGDYAFRDCTALQSVSLEEGSALTEIGHYAFSGCSNLTSVTIPASVTLIGNSAFSVCGSLTELHFTGTAAEWKAIVKGSSWRYNAAIEQVICKDDTLTGDDIG